MDLGIALFTGDILSIWIQLTILVTVNSDIILSEEVELDQQNIVLPCPGIPNGDANNDVTVSSVQWSKDDEGFFIYFVTSGENTWDAYFQGKFVFDPETFEMTLKRARPGDEGSYMCIVVFSHAGASETIKHTTSLSVVAYPDLLLPTLSSTTVQEHHDLNITCSVYNVYPPSEWTNFTIYIEDTQIQATYSNITVQQNSTPGNNLVNVTFLAVVQLSREYNQKSINCSVRRRVEFDHEFELSGSTSSINVTYPPSLVYFTDVQRSSSSSPSNYSITCLVNECNPPCSVQWSLNGDVQTNSVTTDLQSSRTSLIYSTWRGTADQSGIIACGALWMGKEVLASAVQLSAARTELKNDTLPSTDNSTFSQCLCSDSEGSDSPQCLSPLLALGLVLGLAAAASITISAYLIVKIRRLERRDRQYITSTSSHGGQPWTLTR